MKIQDLKANPKNPRKISAKKLAMLKKSLEKFGDLSGFVYNVKTNRLVSGHQRQKALPKDATIKIEERFDSPTGSMTVAEGYVLINGERFKYREVNADETWEMEALLAANKHSGEWDIPLLKIAVSDLDLDMELAGFDLPEMEAMGIEMKPSIEETDEEYVANTPETTEQIPTESIGGQAKSFESVEEKSEVAGKRIVIIIDCGTAEVKDKLREELRQPVEAAGAKFF